MKNSFVTAGLILLTAMASAQIVQPSQTPQTPGNGSQAAGSENIMKAQSGDNTFEMNFNPFGSSPLSLNYLRFRHFVSDDIAIRAGLSVGMRSQSDNKTFEWALLPGIEKHFTGTNRLSPYVGGEISVAGKSASSDITTGSGNTSVNTKYKGAWADGSNRAFFNFGVSAVLGCDVYLTRHFYMGVEGGFGFSVMSYSDLVVTVVPNGGTTTITTTKGGSTFQLGPNFNSAIRVGFAF